MVYTQLQVPGGNLLQSASVVEKNISVKKANDYILKIWRYEHFENFVSIFKILSKLNHYTCFFYNKTFRLFSKVVTVYKLHLYVTVTIVINVSYICMVYVFNALSTVFKI